MVHRNTFAQGHRVYNSSLTKLYSICSVFTGTSQIFSEMNEKWAKSIKFILECQSRLHRIHREAVTRFSRRYSLLFQILSNIAESYDKEI